MIQMQDSNANSTLLLGVAKERFAFVKFFEERFSASFQHHDPFYCETRCGVLFDV